VPVVGAAYIEMWLHLVQPPSLIIDPFISPWTLTQVGVTIIDESSGQTIFPVPGGQQNPTMIGTNSNLWSVPASILANATSANYLRFEFSTATTMLQQTARLPFAPVQPVPGVGLGTPVGPLPPIGLPPIGPITTTLSLADWVQRYGLFYLGSQGSTVVAFARIDLSSSPGIVNG
jgi:hypothetical protein